MHDGIRSWCKLSQKLVGYFNPRLVVYSFLSCLLGSINHQSSIQSGFRLWRTLLPGGMSVMGIGQCECWNEHIRTTARVPYLSCLLSEKIQDIRQKNKDYSFFIKPLTPNSRHHYQQPSKWQIDNTEARKRTRKTVEMEPIGLVKMKMTWKREHHNTRWKASRIFGGNPLCNMRSAQLP